MSWHLGVLVLGDVALLELIRLAGSHLGRKDARGEAVDADLVTILLDLRGEHARKVDSGALGGVVGEVVLGDLDHAGDGCDVEDGTGPALMAICGLLQERQEGSYNGDVVLVAGGTGDDWVTRLVRRKAYQK